MLNGYVKVLSYTFLEVGEHLGGVTITETLLIDDNMGGKCRKTCGHSGGVQIVDLPNMIHIQDMRTNLIEIEPVWREFHEHTGGLAHQLESARDNEGRDEKPRDGIRPLEPGRGNSNRGDNHTERTEGIIKNLRETRPAC